MFFFVEDSKKSCWFLSFWKHLDTRKEPKSAKKKMALEIQNQFSSKYSPSLLLQRPQSTALYLQKILQLKSNRLLPSARILVIQILERVQVTLTNLHLRIQISQNHRLDFFHPGLGQQLLSCAGLWKSEKVNFFHPSPDTRKLPKGAQK